MKCPRCQSAIAAAPDAAGLVVCPSCGARLRSRPTAPAAVDPGVSAPATSPDPEPTKAARNPNATLPPGTPMPRIPRPASLSRDGDAANVALGQRIDTVMEEVKAIRSVQEEILALLRQAPSASEGAPPPLGDHLGFGGFTGDDPGTSASSPVVRARRKKTVLLVDDDPQTLKASVAALEQAEVPVRSVSDGNGALAAIAKEKPDVIVMELGMGGPMGGKDVINMIKATMEWLDIPIILYTRLPIDSQKEARTVHGADEIVAKDAGPASLVARVITVFRKA